MGSDQNDGGLGKAPIIQAVQTPLAFFALAVLIIEVVLGILAARASGWDYSVLLCSMVILLFGTVLFIGVIINRHPEMLFGAAAAAELNIRH